VVCGVVSRRWRGRPAPIAGLFLGAAAALAVHATQVVPPGLVVGLLALAVVGNVAHLSTRPSVTGLVLAIPGAWIIAVHARLPPIAWVQILVVVGVVGGGTLVADFDHHSERMTAAPVLVAVTAVGLYFTVPDTEHARALLGASACIALLGWPWPMASLGRGGAYVATAVILWTAGIDGAGRYGSIVGGSACLGLLVVEPLARALAGGRPPFARVAAAGDPRLQVVTLATIQLAFVFVAARVAGLRRTGMQALAIVAVQFCVTIALGTWLAQWETPT
jgi:hypothetical protein